MHKEPYMRSKIETEWISILISNFLILMCCILLTGCIRNMSKCLDKNDEVKQIITPISKEVTHCHLPIEGTCPGWLNGTFVRNGPVSIEIDGQKMCHWFDGLAMIHSFTFQDGKLSYSNKYLRTEAYDTVFHEGNFNFLGFASLPKHPILKQIKAFFNPNCPPLQNANVNVVEIAHNYSALTEIPLPVRFNLTTAETLGPLEFQDDLPKANVFDSAHPHYDRRTQEKYNYIVDFGPRTQYIIYRYHPERPCREAIAKIPAYRPSYMHSFAMTEHYFVLVEFPLIVNPIDLLFLTKPFIMNYYWKPEQGTQFTIVDRRTGSVVNKIKHCQPFFAFHHVNAYEEKDNIILDIVTYPNADIISQISDHGYLSSQAGDNSEVLIKTKLMRYCLSPAQGTINSKVLFAGPFELPRINEQFSAYAYRYVYGSDQRSLRNANDLRPLYKIDTKTQKRLLWQEPGLLPGEPVFIPRPCSKDEEDGVIVSVVLDDKHHKAFLLILDAETFKELGRAYAPFAIPVGLHGQFFK